MIKCNEHWEVKNGIKFKNKIKVGSYENENQSYKQENE